MNVAGPRVQIPGAVHLIATLLALITIRVFNRSHLRVIRAREILRITGVVQGSQKVLLLADDVSVNVLNSEIVILLHPQNILVIERGIRVDASSLRILLRIATIANGIEDARSLLNLAIMGLARRIRKVENQTRKLLNTAIVPNSCLLIVPRIEQYKGSHIFQCTKLYSVRGNRG